MLTENKSEKANAKIFSPIIIWTPSNFTANIFFFFANILKFQIKSSKGQKQQMDYQTV